jgi:uncharacterized protein (TIGR02118 family)
MIKVLEFFRRRADLDHAAFIHHWQSTHTHVVLGLPGIQRYVQNPVLPALNQDPIFDGVVEVWFPSLDVMRANGRSDYWPILVADEERFIDRTTAELLLIEDPNPPPVVTGLKVFSLLKRPDSTTETVFREAVILQARRLGASVDFPMARKSTQALVDAVVATTCQNLGDHASLISTSRWEGSNWTVFSQLVTEARPIPIGEVRAR